MPRRQEPTKDGANTEMPRGAVSRRRSGDVRMGEPALFHRRASVAECIGSGGQPGELKHLSTLRKRKQGGPCEREPFVGAQSDFLSSGERNGNSPNPALN